jgi:5'-nucleotidase
MSPVTHSLPDWSCIDTVCLDLDGTLLDQAYDNHIWRDLVPQRFAVAHALDTNAAYAEIARRFEALRGTLNWYCIDHWSRNLGIDIGALHREVRSHVAWLPGAREFLTRMRDAGKRLLLLTNSHPVALAVKHEQTGVLDYLDASATSHEFGHPKEHAQFWRAAVERFEFEPARSLFADDNSRMLEAASAAGVRWVYGIRHWDTRGPRREHPDHPAVDSVAELVGGVGAASYRPLRR